MSPPDRPKGQTRRAPHEGAAVSAHSVPDDSPVFRATFDANPDGVLLVDMGGRILLANAAVTELLGYAPEALEGLPVDALVPDAVAPRHAALRHGYALAPSVRPMGTDRELMARRADGSHVMVEIALSPMRVGSGDTAVDCVIASIRGVGAYPRVKRALLRARYNEFLVQLGRVAVDTLNPDELLQRMPSVVQEALEADAVSVLLLSANRRELRRASHSGIHAELDDPGNYPNLPEHAAGYVVAQRAPLVVADIASESRFVLPRHLVDAGARSTVAVPLIDRGNVIGVVGAWSRQAGKYGDDEVAFLEALATLLATTLQRSQAEAQARHAQRLETVGHLTGGVAHDFNNLLTVIQGNLQMLADRPAVRADAVSRQMLAAAARAGQRGADLTGKLLAFSRHQSLEPEPVDPIELLNSMADMLLRSLGENIRIDVRVPSACPRCLVDAVQLESALLNVAVNARDAMPQGGALVLRCGTGALPAGAAPRDTQADAPRQWVWLSVQDNGSGMSQDVLDRAFEPFFTTKGPGRGTGLGLSTVYGFIKQSGGHVELESALGVGTTVTLYLPAHVDDEACAAEEAEATASVLARGLRVLLVEDDADVREVALSFLTSLGCNVVACATAEDALPELERNGDFGLVFSDIMLGPGMDGRELAQWVNVHCPGLPILLCSGYSRQLPDSSQPGATVRWPTLRKPYTRQALSQAIATSLLGGTR